MNPEAAEVLDDIGEVCILCAVHAASLVCCKEGIHEVFGVIRCQRDIANRFQVAIMTNHRWQASGNVDITGPAIDGIHQDFVDFILC